MEDRVCVQCVSNIDDCCTLQSTHRSPCSFLHNSTHLELNTPVNTAQHPSINQPTNEPINQSINQSMNISINQSINESINQPINQSINQSTTKANSCIFTHTSWCTEREMQCYLYTRHGNPEKKSEFFQDMFIVNMLFENGALP